MQIVSLFSCVVEPTKPFLYVAETDTQITNIALGPVSVKPSSSTTAIEPVIVKLQYEGAKIDDVDDDEEEEEDEEEEDESSKKKNKAKANGGKNNKNHEKEEDDDESDDEEDDDDDDDGAIAFEMKEVVICSLVPGQIMQAQVNILLKEDDQYRFVVSGGAHPVHLLGHYVYQDQDPQDLSPTSSQYDSDEESIDSDMMALYAEDDGDDDDYDDEDDDDDEGRIQELRDEAELLAEEQKIAAALAAVNEQRAQTKKRPADAEPSSDAAADATGVSAADVSMATSDGQGEAKLSKNQRKKLAKKFKREDGTAAEAKSTAATTTSASAASTAPPASAPAKKDAASVAASKADTNKKPASAPAASDNKTASKHKAVTTPSGLQYTEVKSGDGAACKAGERVSMRYIGRLASGKVFDKNVKGDPFRFVLGRGEVIKGWEEGIRGMRVGAERKLVIPPALAYGARGSPPDIPANATLTFEVKLLGIGK